MATTGAGSRVDVTLKLTQLQNFCKRDPDGYKEDYAAQIRRLESELGILALQPHTEPSARLIELIQFAAAVSSSSYKGKESEKIASMLISLLTGGSPEGKDQEKSSVQHISSMPSAAIQLHRDVRKTCVSALILMRNKGAIEPLRLLELFFRIMSVVPDKGLRELLYKHMINDIRNINKKGKRDEKVNRSIMSFLHRVVSTHGSVETVSQEEAATDVAAKRATSMVCELYRRRVWTDEKAVAIVASAVLSKNITVVCRALRFFLGIEEKMAQDDQAKEEDAMQQVSSIDYHLHSRKTKSRQRHVERQIDNKRKYRQKKEASDWMDVSPEDDQGVEASKKLYPAIEMLRDPQGLAELVFQKLRAGGSIKFETKLLMINFVTRLVGNHELMLLQLYPFLQKYMGGHQRDVTSVLAYCVQACHEGVPPDEVYGLMKTIAHNFITDRCSEEQMAVGINAVRAICARVPSALSVEESKESSGSTAMDIEAFVSDISAYSKHRDRSVSIAAKSWVNFIRETNPALLRGRDRGLAGSALLKSGARPRRFGEANVALGVEGADLLVEYESKKAAVRQAGDETEDDESETSADEVLSGEDEEAPNLVNLDEEEMITAEIGGKQEVIDLSNMSRLEREQLKQRISSTRIFTAADFLKMRKLVEREQRAKRDPREAARMKRLAAKGNGFEELSDDDSDSDDEAINIRGAVNPDQLMAAAKKKRQSKAERLAKIIEGRTEFEAKKREGGSTNLEKKRTKNFQMSKFSRDTREKMGGKGSVTKRGQLKKQTGHEARKRRRKF